MRSLRRAALFASCCLSAVALLSPCPALGYTYDDFNDNSVDSARWNADRVAGPAGISLAERSARLELGSTSSDLNQSIVFHDSKINPRSDQAWQVGVSVFNLVDVNTSPSVRLGLEVSSPNLNHTLGIALKADDGARRLQGFDGDSFGPDFWNGPPADLASKGLLTLSYDPAQHLISLGFANNDSLFPVTYGTLGIDGIAAGTLGTENWGLGGSSTFVITLIATTAGTTVGAGQAYFDNLVTSTIAGDYSGNGKVDAGDYVAWRDNPAAHGGTPGGYTTWRANFGLGGTGAGSAQAVPEPATIALLPALGWLFAMRRGARHKRGEGK